MNTVEILKHSDIFQGMDSDELLKIASLTQQKTLPKSALVISEGDSSKSMYFIKQGSVKATVTSKDGKEMILSMMQSGEHFGELALLDEAPRSANIVTLEKCEFIVMHRADFHHLMHQNPTIAINVIKYLCHRVRLVTQIAQSLALLDVYGRLIKLLYELAEEQENGSLAVPVALTRKDIAARIGSSREMTSKLLGELEKGGYLITTKKMITIVKKLPKAW